MAARHRDETRGTWALCVTFSLISLPALAEPDLDALVETALQQNPQLTAIDAQINALQYKTERVGAWNNPMLMVAYQNAPIESLAFDVEPMTMIMVRLEQKIPWFGKTGDRQDVVRKASEAKQWELQEKRNELTALVKTSYYRLALARHLRALTQEHVSLVEQLVDAVRIKYEVGRAAQQNLLRLEVLRDRLKDQLSEFTRQERELTAAINAALHRAPGTAVETPSDLTLGPPSHSTEKLLAMALEVRPALKKLHATAEMQRASADLAQFEAMPDPTLFASYGLRSELPNGSPGRDLVTIGIGMPLPIFYGSRNAAQALELRQMARATDATRDARLDNIARSIEEALAIWSRSAEKVTTYRQHLVPDAHRTLDATFSSYQVDRANFLSLYEAERDLLTFEKTIRMATVQGLVAQAMLEKTIGRPLP